MTTKNTVGLVNVGVKFVDLVKVDTVIKKAVQQNDWYGLQDLLAVESDYQEIIYIMKKLLNFESLGWSEIYALKQNVQWIMSTKNNRLMNMTDYVDYAIEKEFSAYYNFDADTEETGISFEDYKAMRLEADTDNFTANVKINQYTKILNEIYKDYYYLGSCLKRLHDAKMYLLGQK